MISYLPPRIVKSVTENFTLNCEANTDELLDTAYIWTHNGIRIRDRDPNSIRLVSTMELMQHVMMKENFIFKFYFRFLMEVNCMS